MSVNSAIAGTKFSRPASLLPLMHRQRLFDMLDQGIQYPLTLLSTPAGYGKTTLLAEWLLQTKTHLSTAWISLDAPDNDEYRFWLCLLLALHGCAHDLVQPLVLQWQEQHNLNSQHILSLLINRLLEEPEARYILIIDDYHLITEPTIHQGLTYLIEHLPPQLRLVVASRVDPALPLHRLRARRQVLEIRTEHLQCTPEETEIFLHDIMNLSLTSEEATDIARRTEGWLVGLQLIAISSQSQSPFSDIAKHASGDQRYILDYFTEEVLRQQPEHVQQFLLVTSLFDQFCVPLCDALWSKGQNQTLLELLERKHLFIVALDEEGLWYRYHHLFAEALRHHFRQSRSQEEIYSWYRKASHWYAEQDQIHEAVHYAVLACDWPYVITLLGRFLHQLSWQPEEVYIVQRWINHLPADVFQQQPQLNPSLDYLLQAFEQEAVREQNEADTASSSYQQALVTPLTQREQEVLALLAQGASNQDIAQKLIIAPNTVKRHVQAIFTKLEVRNRVQAVVRARELGLLA